MKILIWTLFLDIFFVLDRKNGGLSPGIGRINVIVNGKHLNLAPPSVHIKLLILSSALPVGVRFFN